MEKRLAFTDVNRTEIIAEQQALGFRLYEEQRYINGNHLIFTDKPYVEPEPVMDYKAEILKLQDEVKKLKDK